MSLKNKMAYEMVMPYHLHMPSYFLETFTEYPFFNCLRKRHIYHLIVINANHYIALSDT